MKILTSKSDDFLYDWLIDLLYQIKIVQGGTALSSTLRRHSNIKQYLIQKQVDRLKYYEDTFFPDDGTDFSERISFYNSSLQK